MSGASEALRSIVKAYDIRGLVGSELTTEIARAVGAAFADLVARDGAREVVIGHDMRDSSPELAAACGEGVRLRGLDEVAIGLCSTDENYYASGALEAPSVMFTASHNPASYNGMKLSRTGARSISLDTGLADVRDLAVTYLDDGIPAAATSGDRRLLDVLTGYAERIRSLVDLRDIRPLRVVVDAGNGMAGLTVPAVFGDAAGLASLPITVIPLYFELDGSFPNHEANPLDPKNLVDLQAAVIEHGADAGLAFDGDADRCFVVDERGAAVSPSAISAIVALREIARARAAGEQTPTILHNLITSRHVPELVRAEGATPVRTKVGHSIIKGQMAATHAVFGGEHSAHYYFRDFWGADSGLLAAFHVLAELGGSDRTMSSLAAEHTPYAWSGEINSIVDDVPAAYTRVVEAFTGRGEFDEFDGLMITSHDGTWWVSVRASNTEPLLRLNVEAGDRATMEQLRDETLALIRA